MKESVFIAQHEVDWEEIDAFLTYQTARRRARAKLDAPVIDAADFPARYRRVCNQLALAENKGYSQRTLERINDLTVRGHQHLYAQKRLKFGSIFDFLFVSFPRVVRQEWKLFWLCSAIFYLPALLTIGILLYNPDYIQIMMDADQVSEFEQMYEPAENERFGESRGADSDVYMFGYYVRNNTGIGLKTISLGVIGYVFTFLILIFNGMLLGVVSGHLLNEGYATQTLFPFVITHGAFELTAIVLSAAAGVRLGHSIFFPGRYTRVNSFKLTARRLMPMILGIVMFFFIAAFIEAFWSAMPLEPWVKYTSGALAWLFVAWYLTFSGRGRVLATEAT